MKKFLNPYEIQILKEAHVASQTRKNADRIKTVLMLDKGLSYSQVSDLLMLDETTIRRYEKEYQKRGIDGLLECRNEGSPGLVSEEQREVLKGHLRNQTYKSKKLYGM